MFVNSTCARVAMSPDWGCSVTGPAAAALTAAGGGGGGGGGALLQGPVMTHPVARVAESEHTKQTRPFTFIVVVPPFHSQNCQKEGRLTSRRKTNE